METITKLINRYVAEDGMELQPIEVVASLAVCIILLAGFIMASAI